MMKLPQPINEYGFLNRVSYRNLFPVSEKMHPVIFD